MTSDKIIILSIVEGIPDKLDHLTRNFVSFLLTETVVLVVGTSARWPTLVQFRREGRPFTQQQGTFQYVYVAGTSEDIKQLRSL